MRTISALDVRARFGQVLDEAAAGERFVVERAGVPVAAIVPLADLEHADPARILERRLAAIDQLRRLAARDPRPAPSTEEIVAWIREDRDHGHRP
jgi:prevent-host-death family protein